MKFLLVQLFDGTSAIVNRSWYFFLLDSEVESMHRTEQKNQTQTLCRYKILIPQRSWERWLVYEWGSQGAKLLTQVGEKHRKNRTWHARWLWTLVFADGDVIAFLHLSGLKKYCHNSEKEDQMLSNNVKTKSSEPFYSSSHPWLWDGKQNLFIHSWINYLNLSYMVTDMFFF